MLSRQVRPPGELPGVEDEEAPLTEGSLTASRRALPASRRSLDSCRSLAGRSEVRLERGLCGRISNVTNDRVPQLPPSPPPQVDCKDERAFELQKCVPGAQASMSASRPLHHL